MIAMLRKSNNAKVKWSIKNSPFQFSVLIQVMIPIDVLHKSLVFLHNKTDIKRTGKTFWTSSVIFKLFRKGLSASMVITGFLIKWKSCFKRSSHKTVFEALVPQANLMDWPTLEWVKYQKGKSTVHTIAHPKDALFIVKHSTLFYPTVGSKSFTGHPCLLSSNRFDQWNASVGDYSSSLLPITSLCRLLFIFDVPFHIALHRVGTISPFH